ncbi:MAG: tRNA 2-thiouridine(34) synthase MnmA [Candidatus Eremiobacteraeota bacterium]|nr:tRNA 2-thiouridine(34) synthase MnmA [Candidatus Eremiobacteraeota bacterium]
MTQLRNAPVAAPTDAPPAALAGRELAALSGGVDSAVAAALALRGGRDAIGVTMRLWTPGDETASDKARRCCGESAFADARRAAAKLGIAHYVVNFEAAFERAVIAYFCAEYLAGRTPNPCVACNNLMKFGALLDFARALGAASVITGHYARIQSAPEGPRLRRAADRTKDQSYMLAGLRREQLAGIVLPLGQWQKEDTRRLARELGLGVADKPDSMDLCFVDGDYRGFIARRFPDCAAAGPVMTTDGRVIGRHDGLVGFTVGQRKGIPADGADGPWFVVRTESATNCLVVGRREELARSAVTCSSPNLLRPELFAGGRPVCGVAACRYRAKPIAATATALSRTTLEVRFAAPVPFVSPGQLLVLYDQSDDEVLASGTIEA